jgi:hypothetical protein
MGPMGRRGKRWIYCSRTTTTRGLTGLWQQRWMRRQRRRRLQLAAVDKRRKKLTMNLCSRTHNGR